MANKIFPQDYWHWIIRTLGIFRSKYDAENIDDVLNEYLSNHKLADSIIPISIPTVYMEDDSPKT